MLILVCYAPIAAIGTAFGVLLGILIIPVLAGWAHAEKQLLKMMKDAEIK
jgi:hypothetical protein